MRTTRRDLLKEMAARHIMVEINLSSNEGILGVEGDEHPFPVYRAAHVPVALSTDDEGVSRIDLTHEYVRAAIDYHLSYRDLKQLARTGMEHDFLPGASLWARPDDFRAAVDACKGETLGGDNPTGGCKAFSTAARRPRRSGSWSGASGYSKPNSRGQHSTAWRAGNDRAPQRGGHVLKLLRLKLLPWTTSAFAKSAWRCPMPAETLNWGHHLVYWVGDRDIGGKMFAMTDLDGTGTGVLWFHCGAERFHELLEREGIFASPLPGQGPSG